MSRSQPGQNFGIRQLKILLKDIRKDITTALSQKDMQFPEIFDDYEQYHEVVNTGKIERFKLINGWIAPHSTILDVGVGDGLIS